MRRYTGNPGRFPQRSPSAIITKAYAPILGVGGIGGLVIGGLIHGWGFA
jgi:hypothetical protein